MNYISQNREMEHQLVAFQTHSRMRKRQNNLKEPFFKIFIVFALRNSSALLFYEEKLFKEGHALLNS